MVKKAILLLSTAACFSGTAQAQAQLRCHTDEVHARMLKEQPEIRDIEARMRAELHDQLLNMDLSKFKSTQGDEDTLFVPIVFHVIHDYTNQDYWPDNAIFTAVEEINELFNGLNPDTSDIIPPYKGFIPGTNKRYLGKSKIIFKLATKDPQGNPTHGIVRKRSYLAYQGNDQAKFDIWPPQSYMNVWLIRAFGQGYEGVAAYALKPPGAEARPWVDGVISTPQQGNINFDNTIAHELGHSLNLDHPWGGTNQPGVACGDDNIDDTPPTEGHPPSGGNGCNNLAYIYDTRCIYFRDDLGKTALNVLNSVRDDANNEGMSFMAMIKIHLDSVMFFPADSGKPFTIVLKHNGVNTGQSFSGITRDNKVNRVLGKVAYAPANAVPDNMTGVGINFRVYDSIYIRDVTFYPDTPSANGEPYTIVLKRNGTTIQSYSGVIDSAVQIAPVHFAISPTGDTNDVYSMQFEENPGVKRELAGSINYTQEYVKRIKITSDTLTTNGVKRYNYFYRWNIQTFDFAQWAPLKFLLEKSDNPYMLAFSNNPGVRYDLDTTTNEFLYDVIGLMEDSVATDKSYFYNWDYRQGDYFKTYSPAVAEALFGPSTSNYTAPTYINYPDTTNSQNVMDYTYCSKMFTYLQAYEMRQTLQNSTAGRNNLPSPANLAATGALAPWPDLPPTADFSVNQNFVCKGSNVQFTNRSWNDTVVSAAWTFSNAASIPTSNSLTTVTNKFDEPGWVSVTLAATGNGNSGTGTITKNNVVYVANDVAKDPNGYIQEFNPGSDMDEYPMFNYYENNHKWELVNFTGVYDNTSIRYRNYDNRQFPATLIGTPKGDYDDFYTPAFDLSALQSGGSVYLNFYSSGAFRTNNTYNMKDVLEISYSGNCNTWIPLKTLSKLDIGNTGVAPDYEYAPLGIWDWKPQSIEIKAPTSNLSKVYFRFRFRPGADTITQNLNQYMVGTGNHFYIDRLHISKWTTDVTAVEMKNSGITLAPNPTTGSAFVVIKGDKDRTARIQVTDVTGKVVYTAEANLSTGVTNIEIPASYISVKGVYLVQVNTGATKHTEKLVVY